MQLQDLSDLPPLAIVAFGISLAVLYFVTKGGFSSGQKSPADNGSKAQVAAVIVDPTALNKATEAVEAMTAEMVNGRKSFERGVDTVSRSIDRLAVEVDNLTKELIRPRR